MAGRCEVVVSVQGSGLRVQKRNGEWGMGNR
jgi:hypothetical protein